MNALFAIAWFLRAKSDLETRRETLETVTDYTEDDFMATKFTSTGLSCRQAVSHRGRGGKSFCAGVVDMVG